MSEVNEREELIQALQAFFKSMVASAECGGLNQLADEDLTFTQIRTLMLASAEEPLQITQIADFLGMSTTAASRGVDHLVKLGLLERRESDQDRRVKLATITPAGSKIINDHLEAKGQSLRIFVEAIPVKHVQPLNAALQPLIADPEFTAANKISCFEQES